MAAFLLPKVFQLTQKAYLKEISLGFYQRVKPEDQGHLLFMTTIKMQILSEPIMQMVLD